MTIHAWEAALLAFDTGDYATAIARLQPIVEAAPGNANAREYLARAHYQRAALRPAEEQARTILAGDPTNEYVTLLLARILERQNRHAEAAGVRRVLVALTGDERHGAGHRALA